MLTLFAICFASFAARADERFSDGEQTLRAARQLMLDSYYDERVDDQAVWRAAVAGVLSGGGEHKWDKLMSPSELADMKGDLSGEVVGLGIEIDLDAPSGIVSVVSVVPGSSAEREGLLAGDKILKLDNRSFKGMAIGDVVRAIRGKSGSSVTLTVWRDGQLLTRTVKRAPMIFQPITQLSLPDGVALVQIRGFTQKTPALLRATLKQIGSARGLVLDLRHNSGGLFDSMMECAGELLPKGKLVATLIRRGGHAEEQRTQSDPVLDAKPTVVLIDSTSASSAEILAGALKQHLGARLVGKRTFGKWNVQRIEDLPNGWAAKITVGIFRSAGGELLDGRGLDPDVEVEMNPADGPRVQAIHEEKARLAADGQLRAALGLLRAR
jgi:carboxyl-terminal processing protease